MTTVKLEKLKLENFKGVGEMEIEPDGENFKIVGDNGSGKTTIFDAFTWLFFDEDSQGQSQFDVKTLKEDGEPEHRLEHSVKGWISFGDDTVELKKTKSEKWQESRGSGEAEMNGHETEYEFAGVTRTKTEYEKRLNERVDLDKLRLLVDPRYFNEQLKWKERREILVDLFNGVSREEIIEADDKFAELEFNGLDAEERRDQIKSQKREISDKLDSIEERIKERNGPKPNNGITAIKAAQQELEELRKQGQKLRDKISEIKASDSETELKHEKREIEDDLREIKKDWQSEIREKIANLESDLAEKRRSLSSDIRQFEEQKDKKDRKEKRIKELSDKRDRLRDEWYEIKDREFDPGQKECPTCGQKLPEDQIEEKRKAFNQEKSENLKSNKSKGQAAKEEQEKLEDELSDVENRLENIIDDMAKLAWEVRGIEENIDEKESEMDGYKELDEYRKLQEKKEKLEQQIEEKDFGPSEKLKKKESKFEEVAEKIDRKQYKINEFKRYLEDQERVEELKEKEEKLATEAEQLERQRQLVNDFINQKINMLEGEINGHFDIVDFKLFEPYATKDGFKAICETMVDGVKYGSTLNNGAKIRGGLDIINTFSGEFGIRAPVWIDNAESITELPDVGGQKAELVVSDEELSVEKI